MKLEDIKTYDVLLTWLLERREQATREKSNIPGAVITKIDHWRSVVNCCGYMSRKFPQGLTFKNIEVFCNIAYDFKDEMQKVDVTNKVEFYESDKYIGSGEYIFLKKCSCGHIFRDPVRLDDNPYESLCCPGCENELFYSKEIKIFKQK